MLKRDDDGNIEIVDENGKSTKLETEYKLDVLPSGKHKSDIKTQKHNNFYVTHTNHHLTWKEAKFIDTFLVSFNPEESAKKAGYKQKNLRAVGNRLLRKDYISDEIQYRQELYQSEQIATRDEILKYFTSVMRGEVKDQFGLDAPLSERTAAAKELAKRIIDTPGGKNGVGDSNVVIQLNWTEPQQIEKKDEVIVDSERVDNKDNDN